MIGYSADTPDKPARTMLALMICPLMHGELFIARIIPVYSLNAGLLFDQIEKLIKIIHEIGGIVFLVIFEALYLLFDPIHLFKNIKNNWLTEKMKKLRFRIPGSENMIIASWGDVIDFYKKENASMLRISKLDYATVYPTNFDKQKVRLTVNMLNERTLAALRTNGYEDTSVFVEYVTRLLRGRLNDPDRAVVKSPDDPRLQFILEMAESFRSMDTSNTSYKHRVVSDSRYQ